MLAHASPRRPARRRHRGARRARGLRWRRRGRRRRAAGPQGVGRSVAARRPSPTTASGSATPARFSFAGSDELAAQIRAGRQAGRLRRGQHQAARRAVRRGAGRERRSRSPATGSCSPCPRAAPRSARWRTSSGPGVKLADRLGDRAGRGLHAQGAARLPAGAGARRSSPTCAREEPDVAGIVGKLTQGAVDAGFVYVTDVKARPKGALKAIELPGRPAAGGRLRRRGGQGRQAPERRRRSSPGCSHGAAARARCARPAFGRRPPVSRRALVRRAAGRGARARAAFLSLPVVAIFVDTPPGRRSSTASATPARSDALRLSLETSAIALAIIVLVGTPAAWLLATRALPRPRARASRSSSCRSCSRPPSPASGCWRRSGPTGSLGGALGRRDQLVLQTAGVVVALTFVAGAVLPAPGAGRLRGASTRSCSTPRARSAPARPDVRCGSRSRPRAPALAAGRGAGLGPRARRVRRHADVRRLVPRHHADRAAGHLRALRRRTSPAPWRSSAVLVASRGALLLTVKLAAARTAGPVLRVEARARRSAAFELDVALEVAPGELPRAGRPVRRRQDHRAARRRRAAAPRRGPRGAAASEVWLDTARRDRRRRPSGARCGYVFQDYALFAHLRAWQNVAYGLRGVPRRERRARGASRCSSASASPSSPTRGRGTLSGGERQRVALARALAPRPARPAARRAAVRARPAPRAAGARARARRVLADGGVPALARHPRLRGGRAARRPRRPCSTAAGSSRTAPPPQLAAAPGIGVRGRLHRRLGADGHGAARRRRAHRGRARRRRAAAEHRPGRRAGARRRAARGRSASRPPAPSRPATRPRRAPAWARA